MGNNVYNVGMSRYYENSSTENKSLVDDFIKCCKSYNRSPKTCKQYKSCLKVFFSWNYIENEDKHFATLRKRDFIRFISYLREKNACSNRIKNVVSTLSSFSNSIEQLYDVEFPTFHNQLRGLDTGVKELVREKTIYSFSEVQTMLNKLVEAKYYQGACYLAVACFSGARLSELLQFKTEWFTDSALVFNGRMYKTPKIRTKGHGVKGKEIPKYAIKELVDDYLIMWLNERERLGFNSEYLFLNTKGRPANTYNAYCICSKISEICNIHFYSHSARHFFCTYLKSLGYPDDIIRMIVGWESVDLVKTYNDTTDEETLSKFFNMLQGEGK